jgi:predicted porin
MSKNRVWIAVVAAFVLCFANLLYAENAPSTNSDAMVDVLKTLESKGVITHQEFETLKQKVNLEAQAPRLKTVAMQEDESTKAMNVVSAMDSGVGFHTGRFDIAFSGEVNGFFVHDRAANAAFRGQNAAVPNSQSQSTLCGLCSVSVGAVPNWGMRSGLLPSDFSVKISTQEHGWDVAVFFGIWPEINNNAQFGGPLSVNGGLNGSPNALGTPGIDFRQNFATLGRAHFGTLKVGRDLGLFGQEAILNDMTLLGAGTPNGNVGPGSVTLGRIGVGYVYTDFLPQVSYTTPSLHGLQAAVAAIQPYDDIVDAPGLNGHGQPMFQAKLTYTAPTHHGVKAKFWGNMMTQELEANNQGFINLGPQQSIRATGVDYGAKLNLKGLELVGYGYNGWGLGTTGLLLAGVAPGTGFSGNADTRASEGWYGQLTYTAHKATLGFSYGQSNLSPVDAADAAAIAGLVRNNSSYIGQFRYAVTKWDNLVAEYIHTRSVSQGVTAADRVSADSDAIALGTIVFF